MGIYRHNRDKARFYTEEALTLMAEHRVVSQPDNFAVWYCYAAKEDPVLVRAIDDMLRKREPFTEENSGLLFERFFGHEARSVALREASERIEKAVSQVAGVVGEARRGAAEYGEELADRSEKLDKAGDLDEIRGIVGEIAGETRKIITRYREMDYDLSRSADQIAELRDDVERIRRETLIDSLTGLANRKQFDSRFLEAIKECEAADEPVSVLMADIDFFKNFNDRYGHAVGDQVLRLVARTLRESIKGRDLAARYGGEEFVILLPNTSLDDAITVANQIRVAVGDRKLVDRRGGRDMGRIGLSLGVAQKMPGEGPGAALERADKALYTAKRNGRNQVQADRSEPGNVSRLSA